MQTVAKIVRDKLEKSEREVREALREARKTEQPSPAASQHKSGTGAEAASDNKPA